MSGLGFSSNNNTEHVSANILQLTSSRISLPISTDQPEDLATFLNGAGGVGITTLSNLGGGEDVFAQTIGGDGQFKTLVQGNGVTLSSNTTTVTLSKTGPIAAKVLMFRVNSLGTAIAVEENIPSHGDQSLLGSTSQGGADPLVGGQNYISILPTGNGTYQFAPVYLGGPTALSESVPNLGGTSTSQTVDGSVGRASGSNIVITIPSASPYIYFTLGYGPSGNNLGYRFHVMMVKLT